MRETWIGSLAQVAGGYYRVVYGKTGVEKLTNLRTRRGVRSEGGTVPMPMEDAA